MKTLEQIKREYKSKCLDGRDLVRLAIFIPENELHELGITLGDDYKGTHQHQNFTKENILQQLEEDVEFGFRKALSRRGISAGLMAEVVMMWNWVLDEGLNGFDEYRYYGLPIFKATAIKYGFENPIGEDTGSERYYDIGRDY